MTGSKLKTEEYFRWILLGIWYEHRQRAKDVELSFVWFIYYWGKEKSIFCVRMEKSEVTWGLYSVELGSIFIPLDKQTTKEVKLAIPPFWPDQSLCTPVFWNSCPIYSQKCPGLYDIFFFQKRLEAHCVLVGKFFPHIIKKAR